MTYYRATTADSKSHLSKLLESHLKALEVELKEKAIKYCGAGSKCNASVEMSGGSIVARLWLDLGDDGGLSTDQELSEATDLARILLGGNAMVLPHKKPHMWVATVKKVLD